MFQLVATLKKKNFYFNVMKNIWMNGLFSVEGRISEFSAKSQEDVNNGVNQMEKMYNFIGGNVDINIKLICLN